METNLELLGQATASQQLKSETVGTVAAIKGANGKLEISIPSITNGLDRMTCYLTTDKGTEHKVTISKAVTADLRARKLGQSDLGWCVVQLTELPSGDKALYLSYPQGSGARVEVKDLKVEGTRAVAEFDDTLLAL